MMCGRVGVKFSAKERIIQPYFTILLFYAISR